MPKPKRNLNTTYISERLQESLQPISRCALTAVVAPMGYGKTTAVNWYLEEQAREAPVRIVRISVYSGNLALFWKSAQDAFVRAGFAFLQDYPCPTDMAGAGMLLEDLCRELAGEQACYLFIDDFHLLRDGHAVEFLCALAMRLPGNVHLIVASRDRFLPAAEVLRLGSRVYRMGTEQLRLNQAELAVYANRCGTRLSEVQVRTLLYSSEGWFSAVYLNLCALSEHGTLPDRDSDIYAMFTAAMIDPLSDRQREFLAIMGLADEFTVEMARFVTEEEDAETLLAVLTAQNAFVKCLPDGVTYRFHHMMKECAERTFRTLPADRQRRCRERYGAWYETRKQYLHAMTAYRQSGDHDALLRVVQEDAGILLASLDPQAVLAWLETCPAPALKAHPLAILVLMRSMFNWRQIPKMMELKALLLAAIQGHPELPAAERGNLLGECDLILSFLCYNDISAMSRLHRSASAQMSRPAISIRKSGGWTFGSPSVLMMFYRAPGELQSELAEMDECMPHYYKITEGHGQGAEKIMRAEADYLQGRFTDAHIGLESAYAQIEGNGQENMTLCCDFLACRLSLCQAMKLPFSPEERRARLMRQHNTAWLNIWNATSAYYHALLGQCDAIPELFRDHQLHTVNFLAPGRPMMDLIENQVFLAQGAYARVIGRAEQQLPVCARPAALAGLTAREYEIVGLMAQRLTNREIAARLYLSEGSVKQYINQIYSKLDIAGDTRTKRSQLFAMIAPKA